MNIDLHIHSTASDGTLTPHAILDLARRLELGAIAITDHDTVDGARQILEPPLPETPQVLSGVEISAAPPPGCPPRGSFHLLGYGVNVTHPALTGALARLQQARRDRNPQIIERLNRLGFDLTLAAAEALAGGHQQLGRPHIARLMQQAGHVADIDEAFARYLGHGRPAYVDKARIPCDEAIETIHAAGGLAVMAHPGITLAPELELDRVLTTLTAMGIDGIEVYYPEHDPHQTRHYRAAARRFDLLMTGGSDFHGAIKPEIQLGSGSGSLAVPMALYDTLIEALARRRSA